MGEETKSESIPPVDGIEKAWRELTASKTEYDIYNKMSGAEVEKLMEEIRKGNPLKKGMERIYGYLRAIVDYCSR